MKSKITALFLFAMLAFHCVAEVVTNWYAFDEGTNHYDFVTHTTITNVGPTYGWRIGNIKSNDIWIGQINEGWDQVHYGDRNWRTNYIPMHISFGPETKWQYDNLRARIQKYEAQTKRAEEFNRTNTNRSVWMAVDALLFEWRPQKGDIELGYRSDGVVVWRDLPEGKEQK